MINIMPPIVLQPSELKNTQISEQTFATNSDAIGFIQERIGNGDARPWLGTRNEDAFYDEQSVFRVLSYAGLDQSSIKDTANYLREDISGIYGPSPSDSTVYRTLDDQYSEMNREEVEDYAAEIMQNWVKTLPEVEMARKRYRLLLEAIGVEISIDPHEERFYSDKEIYDEEGNQLTMYGQLKENRGRKVLRYCTAAIVWPDDEPRPPLTIAIVLTHKGQTRDAILKRLLVQIAKLDIRINLLSGDGEFGTKAVMQYLDNLPKGERPRKVLFRARYSKKKEDYPGEIDQRFPYDFYEGTDKAYRVEGYIIEQKTPEGKETRFFVSSRYYHFSVAEIKNVYSRRFRIENRFRHTKVCKIRTSMDNPVKRIALWAFSHYLELIWEIYRITHQIGIDYDYDLRQKRFIKLWKSILELQITKEVIIYMLMVGISKNQVLRKLGFPELVCCEEVCFN